MKNSKNSKRNSSNSLSKLSKKETVIKTKKLINANYNKPNFKNTPKKLRQKLKENLVSLEKEIKEIEKPIPLTLREAALNKLNK